ncbi:RNA-binding protein [Halobacteriales archaeon QH_10_65_19]|nr:MAG: RNA-binding protein [Halobacteriales archaeon QH_10_65_19]
MTVRVRGIYATALTAMLEDVVQASPAITERFEAAFPAEPADVVVGTTDDRQGIGVHGACEDVETVVSRLRDLAPDTFAWEAALPRGVVAAGEVVETPGSGALIDCGDGDGDSGGAVGFLPYSKTARHVEEGDVLRVQVSEPQPPWTDGRPVLDTTVEIHGALASLVRGGTTLSDGPELADIVPAEPPEGWAIEWHRDADDAELDALAAAVHRLSDRASALDEALSDAAPPADAAPATYWSGGTSVWLWFGRSSRFALDDRRRAVTTTMAGHHRIKAARESASSAVDFVEAICERPGEDEFPFDAVTRQFGPREGDTVSIVHGKPDGRCFDLGPGEVTTRTSGGDVTVRRELTPGGTYDAIGGEIEPGDVAITKFTEGRWWYPTVYRGAEGETRGTYVNVCTPVEVFPRTVRYVDLHVDVVKYPDGTVERVDEAELAAAVDAGDVSGDLADKARDVAAAVENAL